MKMIGRIVVFAFVAAALLQPVSCAWFQQNEPKFVCAGESTIADLPELIAIVTECSAISVSVDNVVPCILAAAGSKWNEDIIACVANSQASQVAGPLAAKPENLTKLRAAVNVKWGKRLGIQ